MIEDPAYQRIPPLSDLTVVEVAESVAGAFCGRMLAAFGARVIKIERPPLGSWTRYAEPQMKGYDAPDAGALFLYDNMGKESVLLDWKSANGMSELLNLVSDADVLVDDWQPQTRRELGVDADTLQSINPLLVNLSLTPFGLGGPYADWQSTPLVSLALGGYLYLSGEEGREPLMLPGYQAQRLTAMKGYAGTMLGLRARSLTGRGRQVEVSEMEALAALHQFTFVSHQYDGIIRKRAGVRLATGRRTGGYPITTLPCKDGYITFSASAPHQWDYVCAMIGREDLLIDPRFSVFQSLKDAADEIDEILLEWVADKTRQEIVELAAGVYSVPASPVFDLSETMQDSQYLERSLFAEFEHPQGGTVTFPRVPFHMSATEPRFSPAPSLGEHNKLVSKACERSRIPPASYGQEPPEKSTLKAQPHLERGLLSGIRVIDLTRVWAGPLVARILADFGAHVVKVSDPRVQIDRTRGVDNKHNRNKDSLALRLDLPEGRDAFLELASVSDIVIESFRPHVMRNFKLGYESLRQVRPDIVMCSISGYGAEGAAAEFPAYGTSVESITGIPSLMGYDGEMPMTSGIAYPDPVTGMNAAAAIMTALQHRTTTGQGQFIDIALAEGPVCQIGEFIGAYAHNGVQPDRKGNSHYRHAPHGVYPCLGDDRWLAIAVTCDEQWQALCGVMGTPGLATDRRFREELSRQQNEAELNGIIASWTKEEDAIEAMNALQAVGVPAGAVHRSIDMLDDPHLRGRDFFVTLDEPDVGRKTYPGQAIITDGLPKQNWRPSAPLGAHNEQILSELLGRAPLSQ
ncbi:MAG: CoA transferase [Chloroflexi bacterium]|nr:CoA transferase [Chloroflexota bacterium]